MGHAIVSKEKQRYVVLAPSEEPCKKSIFRVKLYKIGMKIFMKLFKAKRFGLCHSIRKEAKIVLASSEVSCKKIFQRLHFAK